MTREEIIKRAKTVANEKDFLDAIGDLVSHTVKLTDEEKLFTLQRFIFNEMHKKIYHHDHSEDD